MVTIPPLVVATLWLAVILALLAGFVLLARRWTGRSGEDRESASELLSKFREVHARGELSDTEYRTIKTKLAPELEPIDGSTPPTGAAEGGV